MEDAPMSVVSCVGAGSTCPANEELSKFFTSGVVVAGAVASVFASWDGAGPRGGALESVEPRPVCSMIVFNCCSVMHVLPAHSLSACNSCAWMSTASRFVTTI